MTTLVAVLLVLSLAVNGVLVWYCRKLVRNLWYGVANIDQLQNLLNEYSSSVEAIYQLEEFYQDETLKSVINNTKLITEACRVYKQTIIQQDDDQSDETTDTNSQTTRTEG